VFPQQWEKDDYRMVRFEDTPKQVNKQFAIDLIAKVPPASMKSRVVACDGGGGPTGHPKVYINLVKFLSLFQNINFCHNYYKSVYVNIYRIFEGLPIYAIHRQFAYII